MVHMSTCTSIDLTVNLYCAYVYITSIRNARWMAAGSAKAKVVLLGEQSIRTRTYRVSHLINSQFSIQIMRRESAIQATRPPEPRLPPDSAYAGGDGESVVMRAQSLQPSKPQSSGGGCCGWGLTCRLHFWVTLNACNSTTYMFPALSWFC